MKKILFALLLAVQSLLATEATAAPCVTASFASYLSLGSGGCTIGNLLFTDFSLNGLSAGATDFPGIVLTPTGTGPDAGLNFTFTTGSSDEFIHPADVTATGGKIYEDRIGFKITGTNVQLNASTIKLNGAATTRDGNVSTVQDLCLGGTFTNPLYSTACSRGSTPGSQSVVFVTGVPDLTTSTLTFPPVTTLSVINDIVVDAGTTGSAMLASLSSLFSSQPSVAVPEPDGLLLIGAGLTALLMRRRSRRGRSTPIA